MIEGTEEESFAPSKENDATLRIFPTVYFGSRHVSILSIEGTEEESFAPSMKNDATLRNIFSLFLIVISIISK